MLLLLRLLLLLLVVAPSRLVLLLQGLESLECLQWVDLRHRLKTQSKGQCTSSRVTRLASQDQVRILKLDQRCTDFHLFSYEIS